MNFWDYLYFSFVIFACLIWLAATVLYIDKKLRERRWRKRDARRGGYLIPATQLVEQAEPVEVGR